MIVLNELVLVKPLTTAWHSVNFIIDGEVGCNLDSVSNDLLIRSWGERREMSLLHEEATGRGEGEEEEGTGREEYQGNSGKIAYLCLIKKSKNSHFLLLHYHIGAHTHTRVCV